MDRCVYCGLGCHEPGQRYAYTVPENCTRKRIPRGRHTLNRTHDTYRTYTGLTGRAVLYGGPALRGGRPYATVRLVERGNPLRLAPEHTCARVGREKHSPPFGRGGGGGDAATDGRGRTGARIYCSHRSDRERDDGNGRGK